MTKKDITLIAIIVIIAVIASNITMLYILRTIPFIHSNDFIAIAVALIGIMVTFAIAYQIFNSLNLNKEIEKQNKYIEVQKRYYSKYINKILFDQNKNIDDLIAHNIQQDKDIKEVSNTNEQISLDLEIVHAEAKCGLKYNPSVFPDVVFHKEEMIHLYNITNEIKLKHAILLLKTENSSLADINISRAYPAIILDILETVILIINNNLNNKYIEGVIFEILILTENCDRVINITNEKHKDKMMEIVAYANKAMSKSIESTMTINKLELLIDELTQCKIKIECL